MKAISKYRWIVCLSVAVVLSFAGLHTQATTPLFTDVPSNHPYQQMIYDLQERGFINGFPDDTFRPDDRISRKHVAHLLVKALNLKANTDTSVQYKDVPKSHPYFDDISRVSKAGIFGGDANGNFKPDAPLTRAQMAKVLDLAFGLTIKTKSYFPDAERNHWSYLHIQALASNGITTGDKGYFKPNQPVTRAHYVVFLHRALAGNHLPKPDSNAALTKDGIADLIHRLPFTVEDALINHKIKGSPYSAVRKELLHNVTEPFAAKLAEHYRLMCLNCDMMAFTYPNEEMQLRFEVVENSPNRVSVKTVSIERPLSHGSFVKYTFEKQDGKWKFADYDWQHIGAGSLNFTKEEAIQLVIADYQHLSSSLPKVAFLGSHEENIKDWATNKSYKRLVYRMNVKTDTESFNVYFYSHNGFFDRE